MEVYFDELLKEIEKLNTQNAEGWTNMEMAEFLHMHPATCRIKIKALIAQGKVKYNGLRSQLSMANRITYVPVYILLPSDVINKKSK